MKSQSAALNLLRGSTLPFLTKTVTDLRTLLTQIKLETGMGTLATTAKLKRVFYKLAQASFSQNDIGKYRLKMFELKKIVAMEIPVNEC